MDLTWGSTSSDTWPIPASQDLNTVPKLKDFFAYVNCASRWDLSFIICFFNCCINIKLIPCAPWQQAKVVTVKVSPFFSDLYLKYGTLNCQCSSVSTEYKLFIMINFSASSPSPRYDPIKLQLLFQFENVHVFSGLWLILHVAILFCLVSDLFCLFF